MIFHHHKAIFFHIGKAAGTSVESFLLGEKKFENIIRGNDIQRYRQDIVFGVKHGIWMQHAVPYMIRNEIDPASWSNYYKFSIVRNPFSRLLSVYWYLSDYHEQTFGGFKEFIEALPGLADQEQAKKGNHYTRQVEHTSIDGVNVCDRIVRMEDLPNAFSQVTDHLGLEGLLPKKNSISRELRKKHRIDPVGAYSAKSRKIVAQVYADDFDRFGYSRNTEDA